MGRDRGAAVASGFAKRLDSLRADSFGRGMVPRRAMPEIPRTLPESRMPLTEESWDPAPNREPRGRSRGGEPVANFLADPPRGGFRRLVRVLRLEPGALVLVFVGTVLSSLVSLVQPLLAGSIVGVLQGGGFLAALPFGLVLAGLAVFASGVTAVVNVVGAKAGNRTVRAFRDESAAIALRVPADKLVQHPTADLVARCSIDSEHLRVLYRLWVGL